MRKFLHQKGVMITPLARQRFHQIHQIWGSLFPVLRKAIIAIGLCMFFAISMQAQMKTALNSQNIDASACIELESNNKGFLPPRMTMAERDAIANPIKGLMVFCTDCITGGCVAYYKGEDAGPFTWECVQIGGLVTEVSVECTGATHSGGNFTVGIAPNGTLTVEVSNFTTADITGFALSNLNSDAPYSITATANPATVNLLQGTNNISFDLTGTAPATAGTAAFLITIMTTNTESTCIIEIPVNEP